MNKRLQVSLFLMVLLFAFTQCRKSEREKASDNLSASRTKAMREEATPVADEIKLPGQYLKAFLAVHTAFVNDVEIPAQKRNIENYSIVFEQNEKFYLISFFAKLLPSEKELNGGESELGKDVTYAVDKQTFQVAQRGFHK